MSVFVRLLRLYESRGFAVRTGLNSFHFQGHRDAPFTALWRDGKVLGTGGGVAVQEIHFFETLFSEFHPQRLLVIGNAFGWSTLLLALLNPNGKTLAIDSGVEGDFVLAGLELTNQIAAEEDLPAHVELGTSPQDVGGLVKEHLGGGVDFAFIDGLHTNEQQEKDYDAIAACAHPDTMYVFHDVINWELSDSFARIAARSGMNSRILLRTPSGMGVLWSEGLAGRVDACLEAFSQDASCFASPPV